jgi:hypothetical protein
MDIYQKIQLFCFLANSCTNFYLTLYFLNCAITECCRIESRELLSYLLIKKSVLLKDAILMKDAIEMIKEVQTIKN